MTTRALGFTETTVGKKVLMAATGVVLFGFVLGHLAGNLQFFRGAKAIDGYAAFLHSTPALIWPVRAFLLFCATLHVLSGLSLILRNWRGRPSRYVRRRTQSSTLSSRTMLVTGPLIALYLVYHLFHLTWGSAHPGFVAGEVHRNMVIGFSDPVAAGLYIGAMIALGLHLLHGIWSFFQTVGLNNNHWSRRLRNLAAAVTAIVVLGNISLPLSVLAGWIR